MLRSAALTCAAAAGVPQVLRIGGLFPIFKTEETTPKFDSDGSGPERQAGFLMAVRELNNRTAIPEQDWNSAGHHGKDAALKRWLRDHGVAIKVLVRDSKRDQASALFAAHDLLQDSGSGSGSGSATGEPPVAALVVHPVHPGHPVHAQNIGNPRHPRH